jgi:ABC-type amino acid transport system permease subunit
VCGEPPCLAAAPAIHHYNHLLSSYKVFGSIYITYYFFKVAASSLLTVLERRASQR